jgi:hypothetical protein
MVQVTREGLHKTLRQRLIYPLLILQLTVFFTMKVQPTLRSKQIFFCHRWQEEDHYYQFSQLYLDTSEPMNSFRRFLHTYPPQTSPIFTTTLHTPIILGRYDRRMLSNYSEEHQNGVESELISHDITTF